MLTEEHKEKIKYLNQYKYLNSDIDRKIKSLEDWRNKIFNVTGTLSDMPRNPNRVNTIEEGVAAIDEIEANINKYIDDLVNLRAEIENKINGVQDIKLRELLKCRYLDCQTFEEIAYKKEFSWRWVHTLHERALDKIILD
ncbi:hypothetical protein [Tissierella praeacuta]|uniref:hypothetical protein n=1 Tax=Tissierella praeacuta TaxID=43131 RepID=UPI0028AEA1E9|nr:hypothetical protein [Tissierella praeacuta]